MQKREEKVLKNDIIKRKEKRQEREKWYQNIDGIDSRQGVKNCGSEKGYLQALEIFGSAISQKSEELEKLYREEDWEGYTVKVHALKSSAKIIGAAGLGEQAQKLENAGKAEDVGTIRKKHETLMSAYRNFKNLLRETDSSFQGKPDKGETGKEPLSEECLEKIRFAAEDMDIEALEQALEEMGGFQMSEEEKRLYGKFREKCEEFDYDGIVELVNNRGK